VGRALVGRQVAVRMADLGDGTCAATAMVDGPDPGSVLYLKLPPPAKADFDRLRAYRKIGPLAWRADDPHPELAERGDGTPENTESYEITNLHRVAASGYLSIQFRPEDRYKSLYVGTKLAGEQVAVRMGRLGDGTYVATAIRRDGAGRVEFLELPPPSEGDFGVSS
jgi:hypothetical protein